ncbi:MAG: PH domain-containing protein [Gammaproteobacteria bacterium]|nr:PH domain-containing protein [Gammaproteobacteria bacterium]MBU1441829.1 PH domain-containing protein [Gammaproteobacteria bacterium]MBU2407156.1 PH domain-containing protein [Gammaproteobacteria bacterium]
MKPFVITEEQDFEPAHGLPERLPASERILWQGAPDARRMALDVVHVRELAVYFAVLLVWRGAHALSQGHSWGDALLSMLWLAPLALAALGIATGLAWLMARTTCYTVTNRRVVMRIGIVLTVTFNLPLARIESASLHARADGSGDIALALEGTDRIAYAHLWPHARPWKLARTQPMLRSLPDAGAVAQVLSAALAESAGQARIAIGAAAPTPARAPVGGAREHAANDALAA